MSSTTTSLNHGTIAGIALGSSVAVVLLLSFILFLLRKVRRQRQDSIKSRATISAPIPINELKELQPTSSTSPTSSRDCTTMPPMADSSNSASPLQRFEDALSGWSEQTLLGHESILMRGMMRTISIMRCLVRAHLPNGRVQ